MRIVVTGGAGFIGTWLVRRLLADGHSVTVVDNFHPQVHARPELAGDIAPHVRLFAADVTDRPQIESALAGQDVLIHLAAETGTGQSMYAVAQYERSNGLGTAMLLDCLVNDKHRTVSKVIVASSRAIYGEGQYRCPTHGVVYPSPRDSAAMDRGQFEPVCPTCAEPCVMLPTAEDSPWTISSYYGLTKLMQERAVLMFAEALGIAGLALRFQNVFGPGQSLQNPYTGILAVFSNLARDNKPINVFEDGLESRDFIYVEDAVESICRALEPGRNEVSVYNVGTGVATSVMEVARTIVRHLKSSSDIRVTGQYRKGDIRHCIADTHRARQSLGFTARWSFDAGLARFLEWATAQPQSTSGYEKSLDELRSRGLMRG